MWKVFLGLILHGFYVFFIVFEGFWTSMGFKQIQNPALKVLCQVMHIVQSMGPFTNIN